MINEQKSQSEVATRILAAAVACFSEYGYHGSTSRIIANSAGVNEATIFKIFRNKKELMRNAILLMTPGTEDMDLSRLTYGSDVYEDIKILIINQAMLHIPHMSAYRLSLKEDIIYDRQMYYLTFSKIKGFIVQMAEYLENLCSEGLIIKMDFLALAEYVNGLILTKTTEFLITADPLGAIEDFANQYAGFFTRLLTQKTVSLQGAASILETE